MADARWISSLPTVILYLTASHLGGAVNVCPTRIHRMGSPSILVQSSDYPNPYNPQTPMTCTLTIPLPAYSLVRFVADGDDFDAPCPLRIKTPRRDVSLCGKEDEGDRLNEYYSTEPLTDGAFIQLTPTSKGSSNGGYKFSINSTVFTVLGTNTSRMMTFQSQLYFLSHRNYFTHIDYNHNTDSSLTVTDLLPHSDVMLEFPEGVRLGNADICSDYFDIIGVRGYPNYAKRICRNNPIIDTSILTTTGSEITLRFKTYSADGGRGFILKYSVIGGGCSDNELLSNATLSPTPDSNTTFTLTCLPGFAASNFTQPQIIECKNESWTPFFSCLENIVTTTSSSTPTTQMMISTSKSSLVGGGNPAAMTAVYASTASAAIAVVVIFAAVIILVRRRRHQTSTSNGAKRTTIQRSLKDNAADAEPDVTCTVSTIRDGVGPKIEDYPTYDPLYESSDIYRRSGDFTAQQPSSNLSLMGPSVASGYKKPTKREERKVADIYAVVDVSHKRTQPMKVPPVMREKAVEGGSVVAENDMRKDEMTDNLPAVNVNSMRRPPQESPQENCEMVENDLYTSSF